MDRRVKRLPITTSGGTRGPRSIVTRRLGQMLAPSTKMKRWLYAGLIMLILSHWYNVDILAFVAYPILAVCISYFIWRFALRLRDRLFWKVRNRILASFVFVGVVPIGIVTVIGLIIVWFLIGAMGTNRIKRQFDETLDRLDHIPLQVQLECYRTSATSQKALAESVQRAWQANHDLQSLWIGVFERKGSTLWLIHSVPPHQHVKELPEWAADRTFAGMVIDGSTGYFRAVSTIDIGKRRLSVLASIPLNRDYQRVVWEQSGVSISSPQFSQNSADSLPRPPDTAGSQDTSRADQAWGMGTLRLPWGSLFKATDWQRGPEGSPSGTSLLESTSTVLFLGLLIDPVRIIRDSLTGDSEMVNRLFIALIALCASLAIVELVSFSIGFIISRRITSAVHSLSLGTQAIRSGQLDFRIETRKHDQLGELARSFNAMAESIQVLLAEVADKERIEAELAMARDVQAQFFPKRIPRIGRLELAGSCVPARMVSGDYYDFIVHGDTILDIVVSDISGKGMSAALMMAGLQSALRAQSMAGIVEAAPGRLVRTVGHLNQYLCRNTAPDKFATLFIGSYDLRASTLSYCCAGHNPPYLLQNGRLIRLFTGGCPIGFFPDWQYEEATVSLNTGDLVFIYTDGIPEAQNLNEEEFGEQRLERFILDHRGLSCEDMQARVLAAVRDFAYGVEQYDDQTMVIGKVK